jgi:hypothetical protein
MNYTLTLHEDAFLRDGPVAAGGEVGLRGTRVPSFSKVDKAAARKLIRAVEARLSSRGKAAFDLEAEIDEVAGELYGLTSTDREIISGMNRVQ